MKRHFSTMADYNAWANRRLYAAASELSDEQYRRDVGAFFKSLHGTLNHILVADLIWMHRLTSVGQLPQRLDATVCDDLSALQVERQKMDQRIIDYVASLSDEQLGERWSYRMLNGARQEQLRWETLAHLFNHQTHHRGQAHAILTVLGVREPQGLDLLLMQRERA